MSQLGLESQGRPRRTHGVLTLIMVVALALTAVPNATAQAEPEAGRDDSTAITSALEQRFERNDGEAQDFWITFDERADTSAAHDIEGWGERGQFVVQALRDTARTSQEEVIETLKESGVEYTPLWVTNAIKVHEGSYELALAVGADPGVESVRTPVVYKNADPVEQRMSPDSLATDLAAVEWGIGNVKADQVWRDQAVRGDGIVVASIDTGVDFTHPTLADSFRGNNGDGTYDTDYNWYDPLEGSSLPIDTARHGTHTMGTMVGEDEANQIGVAPGARWIAARGCCSDDALLKASQWMLAPTRGDGSDARPEMRPNIINNSWGSVEPGTDPFLEDIQIAWAAAGIFGVWSNGNNGPGCNTAGFPGSRVVNYAVGAYDVSNLIAPFSSRGGGQDGETKPNLSAPGVNVRSAIPGNGYAFFNGTSMAAPHVAGAIALLWSAQPSLVGDIAATRQALDDTATDSEDTTCGGTADDNNVYGEGRLDALALVNAQGTPPTGTISGTIGEEGTDAKVAGAVIRLVQDGLQRSTRSGNDGGYLTDIQAGTYEATVTAFGYQPKTVTITVAEGEATTTDIELVPALGQEVTGRVVDSGTGEPVYSADVSIVGGRFSATTSADGTFTLNDVPGPRRYLVQVDGGPCTSGLVYRSLQVDDSDVAMPDVSLGKATETSNAMNKGPLSWGYGPAYGYTCAEEPAQWVDGGDVVPPEVGTVDLPFTFTYFGRAYSKLTIFVNGAVMPGAEYSILAANLHVCKMMMRYGDDFKMLTKVSGSAPNRQFTLTWQNSSGVNGISCQMTVHEAGDIVYAYRDIDPGNLYERGSAADVNIRRHSGDERGYGGGLFYGYNDPVLEDQTQIRFSLPANGFVEGQVLDDKTRAPIANATVDVFLPSGTRWERTVTDADGRYRVQLMVGKEYAVQASRPLGYPHPDVTTIQLDQPREVKTVTHRLSEGRFKVQTTSVTAKRGAAKDTTFSFQNSGGRTLEWWSTKHLPDGETVPPGAETFTAPVPFATTTAIEEVGGSYWVSGLALAGGNPVPAPAIREVTAQGEPTGRSIPLAPARSRLDPVTPVPLRVPGDLAWVASQQSLCMAFNLPLDPRLACVDPNDGAVTRIVPTGLPEGVMISGLAYNAERDVFYVAARFDSNGRQQLVRTVDGLSSAQPGRILNDCVIARGPTGLAYNPASRSLYATILKEPNAKQPFVNHILQFDPQSCAEITSQPFVFTGPGGQAHAQGLGLTADGDVVTAVAPFTVAPWIAGFKLDDPLSDPLPWLGLSSESGSLERAKSEKITVTVDWERVPDDVDRVKLVLHGNGGDQATQTVWINLER